jgi:hypothetical protein
MSTSTEKVRNEMGIDDVLKLVLPFAAAIFGGVVATLINLPRTRAETREADAKAEEALAQAEKLRVETQQMTERVDIQQNRINTLSFLVAHLLAKPEIEHLQRAS